jgi:hypothetical protein
MTLFLASTGTNSDQPSILLLLPAIVFLMSIIGLVIVAPIIKRTRMAGISFYGDHRFSPGRLANRQSNIIEERFSGWMTHFIRRVGSLGPGVGIAVYPFFAAWWYGGAARPVLLPIVSIVCLVGMAFSARVFQRGDKSSGCLPTLFVAIVVTIGFFVAGISVPDGSSAWLFILIGSILSGTILTHMIAMIVGAVAAVKPAFGPKSLQSLSGRSYSRLAALRDVAGFTFLSPMFGLAFAALSMVPDDHTQ